MSTTYYPAKVGNSWTYQMKDGTTYTNSIKSVDAGDPNLFTMFNSSVNKDTFLKVEGSNYLTKYDDESGFQVFLKDTLKQGDSWEIKFKANGLDSILIMTVKETGKQMEVAGKSYSNIIFIESESKLMMNGNLIPLNFFTQYYYAMGVGLVQTTSSVGDAHNLVDCQLK
ncbi:MAG: hypothetical protein ABIP51_06460 [Bacteroidia bacterium]